MPHTRKDILQIGREIADKFFHGKKETATIEAWATKDEGSIWVMVSPWSLKPQKREHIWDRYMVYCSFRSLDLPSVKWEDEEPTPVTLTISIRK